MWGRVESVTSDLESSAETMPTLLIAQNLGGTKQRASAAKGNTNKMKGVLREFRELSTVFFEKDLSEIRKYYVLVERHRCEIGELAQQVSEVTRFDNVTEQKVESFVSRAMSFRPESERFHQFIVSRLGGIPEKIKDLAGDQIFLKSSALYRDFLVAVLSAVNSAVKEVRIACQNIDRIHVSLLAKIIKSRDVPIRLVLRYGPEKGHLVLEDLRQVSSGSTKLTVRQNHALHSRICLVDDRCAIVSSCDLVYPTHSLHLEAGIYSQLVVSSVAEYFEQIWEHSVDIASGDAPILDKTKLIIHYDPSHHGNPREIIEEVRGALGDSDAWVGFRKSPIQGIGYVDSVLTPEEVCKSLTDLPLIHVRKVIPAKLVCRLQSEDDLLAQASEFARRECVEKLPILVSFRKLCHSDTIRGTDQELTTNIVRRLNELGMKASVAPTNPGCQVCVYLYEDILVLGDANK
jgi:hypothetical protein